MYLSFSLAEIWMDVMEGDHFQIVLEMTGTHDNINMETTIKIHKVEMYNSDCAHLRGIASSPSVSQLNFFHFKSFCL